jgi:hypothetical protein
MLSHLHGIQEVAALGQMEGGTLLSPFGCYERNWTASQAMSIIAQSQ